MFNLEKSISEWRKQMLAAGIQSPVPLEELEIHLREEIERQMRHGLNEPQAIETAAQQIGKASMLQNEFKKNNGVSKALENIMIGVGAIFVVFILLLSALTVYLCFSSLGERVMAATAMLCSLLVACGWRHAVPFLPVIASTRKRWAAGLACIAGGFAAASIFCGLLLPHFETNADHQIPAIGFWAVFLIAIFCCLGIALLLSEQEREIFGMTRSAGKRPASVNS